MQTEAIIIYRFNDAPKEWRDVLNDNGGDEDWLAVIPPNLRNDWLPWLEQGRGFGACCVNEYDVKGCGAVYRLKEREGWYEECESHSSEEYLVGEIKELAGCKIAIACHA